MEHLEWLLQRVTQTGLKLKASKCQFLKREVTYLSHTISADGVSCESGKVECVQNWPTPTTTTELRSFLGFASYYQQFISGFARIAGPLHDLVSDGAKRSKKKAADVSRLWGPKHQEAFESLKGALTTAPVLGYADYTKPFILETDARHDGLSAICPRNRMGSKECFQPTPPAQWEKQFTLQHHEARVSCREMGNNGQIPALPVGREVQGHHRQQSADLLSLRETRRVGAKMGLTARTVRFWHPVQTWKDQPCWCPFLHAPRTLSSTPPDSGATRGSHCQWSPVWAAGCRPHPHCWCPWRHHGSCAAPAQGGGTWSNGCSRGCNWGTPQTVYGWLAAATATRSSHWPGARSLASQALWHQGTLHASIGAAVPSTVPKEGGTPS